MTVSAPPLYEVPIDERPSGYGPLWSKVVFPLVFNLGILGLNSVQFLCLLFKLIPGETGRSLYRSSIDWTKDGFGRLLIAITMLCAPTTFVITADPPLQLEGLVERDAHGQVKQLRLPDHLVVMANHQAYTDWMYLWILACYSGTAEGITILLKASLKHVPFVGWGMQFFRFIFLKRSWATDRLNLTHSLTRLAQATYAQGKRHPLWLVIFPEGTITSDNERAKSLRYAQREGIDDFAAVLHPRSTGLLFCLRTLLPAVPDLQLLDVTIGYPGVPFGKYPQEWYSLTSVFFQSVPPPAVRIHLHIYSDLGQSDGEVPSLHNMKPGTTASAEETQAFERWLRKTWAKKEALLREWSSEPLVSASDSKHETVAVKQTRWLDWLSTFGGGGVFTVIAVWLGLRYAFVADVQS